MDKEPKEYKVEAFEMGEQRDLVHAMMLLVRHAMQGGIKNADESMTVIIPPVEIGRSEKDLKDVGEWEIRVRKVS